jgi:hypothetical protein
VTAAEAYDLTTRGGASDFARLIALCESIGPYCLIGGLAVNHYVEPVYTLDADIVMIAEEIENLAEQLKERGFQVERHLHSLNATPSNSQLRIQFTTDARYQAFLSRSVLGEALGVHVRLACLHDVAQGKLWAYSDPARRFSKRKKDELDLVRLAEAYPELKRMYPAELREQIERA